MFSNSAFFKISKLKELAPLSVGICKVKNHEMVVLLVATDFKVSPCEQKVRYLKK